MCSYSYPGADRILAPAKLPDEHALRLCHRVVHRKRHINMHLVRPPAANIAATGGASAAYTAPRSAAQAQSGIVWYGAAWDIGLYRDGGTSGTAILEL